MYTSHSNKYNSNTIMTGITYNAAAIILAMNTQAVLDAAGGIYGTSSRRLSSPGLGILRPTPLSETPQPSNTATITQPRPKPLNFGLDQREREMLHRQDLAVRAMQDASSTPISTPMRGPCYLPLTEPVPQIGSMSQLIVAFPAHSLRAFPHH